MRRVALLALFAVAGPGLAVPVTDAHWSSMAGNLFPALEAIRADRLPADAGTMLAARRLRIARCGDDLPCIITSTRWTAEEIKELADGASRALARDGRRYVPPDDGAGPEVARQLSGLNAILDVYGLGSPARYPQIDGPVVAPGTTPESLANVRYAIQLARAGGADPATALDPSIGLALALLDANDRNEPAAFEPLDAIYNKEAMAKAKTLDWARFRYSAIVIPGVGPDDLATPLSARGKLNVRMAAERFRDGGAPFIILSGSNVHPRGTHVAEAVQMRQALIERFGISAADIVIEPYARHTTTNLRNATRRLVALGAPLAKDVLIVTNADQSRYIESAEFSHRNAVELGYQPGTIGARLSATELTFRPSASSLRVDPMDPLDP